MFWVSFSTLVFPFLLLACFLNCCLPSVFSSGGNAVLSFIPLLIIPYSFSHEYTGLKSDTQESKIMAY